MSWLENRNILRFSNQDTEGAGSATVSWRVGVDLDAESSAEFEENSKMQQETLRAERRVTSGTRASKRLRHSGRVPGVVYGTEFDAQAIHVSRGELYDALHTAAGRNAIIEIDIDGKQVLTVAREIQRNPVRGDITHLDFIQVRMDVEIEAEVLIEFIGVPVGVRDDGAIVTPLDSAVFISALPNAIPSSIEISIEHMGVHDTLKVGDLPEIDGVTYIAEPDHPLLTVVLPAAELVVDETLLDEDAEAEDGAEVAEPAEDEA